MISNQVAQKIWITGASSGIGAALARRLLEQGASLVITARSLEPLTALCDEFPTRCLPLVLDLTDSPSVASAAKLSQLTEYLDVVVINAGTCEYIDVQDFSAAPFVSVMDINFTGAVNTLALALPLLRKSPNRPYIVGVSSMATLLPMPRSEAYGASKAALEYLLNSLRVDLAGENIDVSVVRPGFVQTPLTERNDFAMPFLITTGQAVDYMVKGMRARNWVIQFPWPLVLIMKLCSGLPQKWQTGLLKKMSRNRE